MQISVIEDLHEFDQLRSDWEAVYVADPCAHVFSSWAWLRGWLELTRYRWSVLAIRPDSASPYIAFFPFGMRTVGKHRFSAIRELHMGGKPLADYAGFMCVPEYVEQALAAFAVYVQRELVWDRFHLDDVLDPRLALFLKSFSGKFSVQQVNRISCPYIPLPGNWEHYIQNFLGPSVRRNLRRYSRKIEDLDEFRVTHVQSDNLETQMEALLTFWQARWGRNPEGYRTLLRRCFENNCLWLTVLWMATTPIAALAAFVDYQKRTFSSYVNGFNDEMAEFSPGTVMVGYSIRYAIENGFRVYDFLRGDEAYKYSFGAIDRLTTSVLIVRKNPRNTLAGWMGQLEKSPKAHGGEVAGPAPGSLGDNA